MAVTIAAYACFFCLIFLWTIIEMRAMLNKEWDRNYSLEHQLAVLSSASSKDWLRADMLGRQLECAISTHPEMLEDILEIE